MLDGWDWSGRDGVEYDLVVVGFGGDGKGGIEGRGVGER